MSDNLQTTTVADGDAASVIAGIAGGRSWSSRFWRLAKPYFIATETAELRLLGIGFRMREAWVARGLFVTILVLNIFNVYLAKLFNDWYGRFYDSLQNKDQASFFTEIGVFAWLAVLFIVCAVYRVWLRQYLQIRWRTWLSEVYFARWLRDRAYYKLELRPKEVADNPEQRIEQDCRNFVENTLIFTVTLFGEVLSLVTFSVILWGLSGSITLFGITIPGYMLWAAVLYAGIGSVLAYLIGRPLVRINFLQEMFNADFRFRMTRIRENTESIALYEGEADERHRLRGSLGRIAANWWELMKWQKRLTWFTAFYSQAAVLFPFVVAGSRYFSGAIQLGALMQIVNAFGSVQNSLSWFIDRVSDLAEWKATVDRLTSFAQAMEATAVPAGAAAFAVTRESISLSVTDGDVALPDGRLLLEGVALTINPGTRSVVQGPSGSGKTTLFRVLAGIWPFGSGRINEPAGAKVLFLPQKAYIPLGSLREVVCYPDRPESHDEAEIAAALESCRLGHLAGRLDENENWAMALSPGEQQRLAFARALLVKPDWLFLDEATSALDEATETAMYELLQERLPRATVLSIAHKPGVVRFHDQRLVIDPALRRVTLEPIG